MRTSFVINCEDGKIVVQEATLNASPIFVGPPIEFARFSAVELPLYVVGLGKSQVDAVGSTGLFSQVPVVRV